MRLANYAVSLILVLSVFVLVSNISPVAAGPKNFSISANPTTLGTVGRGSQTSIITLQSLNGFSGNVALSSSSSPSGVTLGLNPTSVTLTSGGTATSTLTVTATGITTPGTYTVAVTGIGGGLAHATSVSFAAQVAPMIAFQSANSHAVNNAVSGSVTMQLVQGDFVFVGISIQNGFFGSVSSLTDNLGNRYSHLGTNTNTHFSVDLWDTTVSTGGSATITAALSISATEFVISASQYSGVQSGGLLTVFNSGASSNVIDVNQGGQAFGPQPGIHWWTGFGGAVGTATMSQNAGTLRTTAVTSNGSGDVSGGIVDVSGTPNASLAVRISLSATETSFAGETELIPFAPLAIAFQSANSAAYNQATSGTVSLTIVQGEYSLVGLSIQNGFFSSVSSVTDNLGNSYTHIGTNTNTAFSVDLWCTLANVGGNAVITASLSIAATQFVISVGQYSGVASGCGSGSFNAGGGSNVIDFNQFNQAFGSSPGTHWWTGFGGAVGTATMSQNNGILRTTAVTNHGSGDVSGGIVDITGNPGAIVDPKISLSASETSFGGMVELIQWAP